MRLNLIASLIVAAGLCGGVYGSVAAQQAQSANPPPVRHVAVPGSAGTAGSTTIPSHAGAAKGTAGDGHAARLGPMAQDFRAAFGPGEDDRHISTIDEDGVTLVAVKALVTEVRAKSSEVERLRAAIAHVSSDEQQLKTEVRELLALARSEGRTLTLRPSQSRT